MPSFFRARSAQEVTQRALQHKAHDASSIQRKTPSFMKPSLFQCVRYAALCLLLLSIAAPAAANFAAGYQAWDQGDYSAARELLGAAAKAGDLDAQNHLGQMEEDGQGGPVNLPQAVSWYRQAANAGHPGAQLNLGRMYRSGKGVEQDDVRAVQWYREAANKGLSIAQFFMGLMYDTGKGVPSDYTQAYKWFDLAARQGDEDARYKRDRLARQMTPSQILEAERLAASFLGEAPPTATASAAQRGGLGDNSGVTNNAASALSRPSDEAALTPSPTAVPVAPAVDTTPLTREERSEAQKILNQLGYHAGTPTGANQRRTPAAAKLFRTDTGRTGTAGLDRELLEDLRYTRANLPAGQPKPTTSKALIRRIQSALNALGYDAGSADGLIGNKTIEAARAYRAALGYKVRDELTHGLLRVTETRLAVRKRVPESIPSNGSNGDKARAISGQDLIKRVQTGLRKLGYDPGPADGAAGGRTRKAVKRFQQREALSVTGRIDVALLDRVGTAIDNGDRKGPRLRFMRPSTQREMVRRAQVRLNSLGYDAGAPDGLSGTKTTTAVKNFQARVGERSSGQLSEQLLKRMEHIDAPKPARRAPTPVGKQLVRQIQSELNRLGYPAGTADGIIGRRTVDAAKAFQRDIGLADSGKLTPGLLRSLRAAR